MRIFTEREQIRDVADRWSRQYRNTTDENKLKIGRELWKLNTETATTDDVVKIIGNDSWIKPKICYECGVENYSVIQLGEELDGESYTTYVCYDCLVKIVDWLENKK